MDYPLHDLGKSLLEAARRGDEREVRNLLTKGAPFTTDWLGNSPLHFAALYGHLDTVLLLMRAGMSCDARTKVNKTPLHIATQSGHEDLVKAFLAQGANVNARDMLNMTPLHWASQNNFPDIAEILLENGAVMDLKNKFDKTATDICMENGCVEILKKAVCYKERSATDSPESLYMEEKDLGNSSESEKPIEMTSPSSILSSLSSLAGISQESLQSTTVTVEELALLQSTPINYSTIPVESIRSIVLTDAGRLAMQFLNKGLENSILQACSEQDENDENEDTNKLVSYKDVTSRIDQNPEQYLNTSRGTISKTSNSKNHKVARIKDSLAVSDLLPSTSSGISLPPVFPECNLRNSGENGENYELDLDTVLLQSQLDSSRHSIDLTENFTVKATPNGLQFPLTDGVCKKL